LPLTERRKSLQGIVSKGSPIVSEALSVAGRGRELFELMYANDLEGIVAKRLADPYDSRIRWLKIKNPDYSQKEGRGDLFNGPRQRTARTAGAPNAGIDLDFNTRRLRHRQFQPHPGRHPGGSRGLTARRCS